MKAKELAKMLLEHPEAEVGFEEYGGSDTPFLTVKKIDFFQKGEKVLAYIPDGGNLIGKSGYAKCDIINLKTY